MEKIKPKIQQCSISEPMACLPEDLRPKAEKALRVAKVLGERVLDAGRFIVEASTLPLVFPLLDTGENLQRGLKSRQFQRSLRQFEGLPKGIHKLRPPVAPPPASPRESGPSAPSPSVAPRIMKAQAYRERSSGSCSSKKGSRKSKPASKRQVGSVAPVTQFRKPTEALRKPKATASDLPSLNAEMKGLAKKKVNEILRGISREDMGGELRFDVVFDAHPEYQGAMLVRIEVTDNSLTGLPAAKKAEIEAALNGIKKFSRPPKNPLDRAGIPRFADLVLSFK